MMAESTDTLNDVRCLGMLTDVGRVRKIDEDSIMATEISFAIESKTHKLRLLVVADGMGGHAKGEEASRMALKTISKTVISGLFDDVSPAILLKQGIQNANQDILDYVSSHPESNGMGTTVVCALVKNNDIFVANIGDSRAYAISNEEARRITKDHSYVQELMDEKKITEAQSRTHPNKNVITMAVGIEPQVEPDLTQFTLDSDESLLLCCDGVVGHLTDDDIRKIIIDSDEPQTACQKIVDIANERGGSDNISLVLLSHSSKNDMLENISDADSDNDEPTLLNEQRQ